MRSLITVAPISTRVRNIPVEIELGAEEGLPKRCAANLDSLVTIPKARLERRIASLSAEKLRAAAAAVHFALDLGSEGR